MKPDSINIREKFLKITEYYQPKIIARLNDYHFKLVKVKGDFVWHSHPETDEAFIIIDGELEIEFREGKVALKTGEMCIVPKGVEHKPFAGNECCIMLIEPAGTLNTGNSGGERAVENPEWI
jgi:mannose-6-phosphate isomerase-like protein (cupin superfamily)